jgi:hypothetical protein
MGSLRIGKDAEQMRRSIAVSLQRSGMVWRPSTYRTPTLARRALEDLMETAQRWKMLQETPTMAAKHSDDAVYNTNQMFAKERKQL